MDNLTTNFINLALNFVTWVLIVRTWWVVEAGRGVNRQLGQQLRAMPHDVEDHRRKMNPKAQ